MQLTTVFSIFSESFTPEFVTVLENLGFPNADGFEGSNPSAFSVQELVYILQIISKFVIISGLVT